MNNIQKINVLWDGRQVGHVALTKEGLCSFEYSPAFILDGISISPFELPLQKGVFIARPTPFAGGFGVFDDSLPDGWGLLVLDRYLQKRGISPGNLTLLERLALTGSTGRGALEFVPDRSAEYKDSLPDFEKLAFEASEILGSEEYYGEGIEEFQQRGGSPGGARPKVFTKYDGTEWLVKFRAKGDPRNIGKIEYDYSLLAKQCGVEMPETRLFEGKYFGVERFDRVTNGKVHTVSVAGLLCADYRIPSIDYLHIFKICRNLVSDARELWKIYRLMVFNYLIGNKDDHAKNFAFQNENGKWKFAPAFDLLPSDGMNGFRTTSINDSIEPKREDLLAVANMVGLDNGMAVKVYDEMYEAVKGQRMLDKSLR